MTVSKAVNRILDLPGLLDDLVAQGYVSRQDANRLIGTPRTAEQAQMHPLSYIASCELQNQRRPGKVLDAATLTQWLADTSSHGLYHIDPLKVNVGAVTEVMSFQFAKRHQILCVEATKEMLLVATAQPYASGWEEQLEHTSGRTVQRVVADPADIQRYCVEFYSLANSISGASGLKGSSSAGNFEQLLELGKLNEPDADDQHIVNIVDWLLQHAFDQRASDIHIEPRRGVGRIRFRIDGVLHPIHELPDAVNAAVTSRLKILGRMNVAEKRKPQDGRIKTKRQDGSEVELRLSTLPTAFGEKLVMRIFDPEVLARSYADLGLGGEDLARWQKMLSRPNGIVLVTGPTGSGKTTTLYTGLKQLATSEVNVSTIEDPIEMVEESFNQTQVQHSIGLDFAAGIRTLMRQDPDIIMVGEIRDLETAEMAVQAALTGHLVISTLHTNDAPTAVTRLLDLGLPHYLLKSTVIGVMAQRLVRTLCPACKRKGTISEEDWQTLVRPWKAPLPETTYRPEGCLECRNTGYLGRQGIYEILPFTESIQALVTADCDLQALRHQAMREGMNSLRLSGARKVAAGITTVAEVLRVAPPPDIAF
ncbi:GspE/PulE family protein [Microbulbifer thermotolerans]|uniref:GspE/PulE family protein n=1 Tax=Microbulbifer thermotolerans TaxID=252514 RepID=A0A143HPV7_MICTH|nr:GspE/PulE family protein [Microbulbifer thermotolerans]AMX03531.1 type II secretion system protein E [Microbulbifer thermotolerans]MCX2778154.1 GspE/PulE family protein [Microbulbifer thermotolerans]MCX2801134.1 GspE/PulE family protein [Microbulbifer thermotolerans]MCX2804502.1 GspE/PulE family protein [Microbulbifer thermotolerans]SFD03368.1 general secretion pathway protein E [Microbulbifer thermotolerans]